MFNYIWCGMIMMSVITSFFTGNINQVANAAMEGAASAVTMSLELLGIMAFWNGIMNIAGASGIIDKLAVVIKPVYRLCFKNIPPDSAAGRNILLNITANVMGLGNAATPFGLKAMEEMGKTANGTATDEMVRFLVLNTASIQLLPTTMISMRAMAGSANPAEILVPVWIVSVCALAMGLFAASVFKKE